MSISHWGIFPGYWTISNGSKYGTYETIWSACTFEEMAKWQ